MLESLAENCEIGDINYAAPDGSTAHDRKEKKEKESEKNKIENKSKEKRSESALI